MINFPDIDLKTFLTDYWQKKPLVLRNAIPNFVNPLTPDELAGLALEEEIESRLVWEKPQEAVAWHLKRGPFLESDFTYLPKTHWTLLVQGVDRAVPEVSQLLTHFDFIPQWRIDDVMISFASLYGSVGPHYDNYDVFLYQAKGRRLWSLTSKDCHEGNYLENLELRIMKTFETEEQILLEEGDMLYLPPHIGHYGISQSNECMTYSFGYRSYQGQELWDSFGEYLSEENCFKAFYKDPDWSILKNTSEITKPAWVNAQALLRELIQDENKIKSWFGCFATRLDLQAEQYLPTPLQEEELVDLSDFIATLQESLGLVREESCRFAYQEQPHLQLFINGCAWPVKDVSPDLVRLIANQRVISQESLKPLVAKSHANQLFLYELWTLQWLRIYENA